MFGQLLRFKFPLQFTSIAVAVLALPFLFGGAGSVAQQPSRNPTIRPSGKVNQPGNSVAGSETESNSGLIEGFTEPYADILLAASEMGTLSEVMVKDGDEVKAGQMLAKVDDGVLLASLAVAKAGMEAEGELRSAQTQLELKKVELQKLNELFGRQHASQKELDRVNGEVAISEARIQSVREELHVRALEYARIEAQLKQRQIVATIDGVVVEVRKDRGEFVSPSDPVVARVVQLDPLLVVFSVPSTRRNEVKAGETVSMQIGESADPAQGLVEYVSPTTDASSGTFRVKIQLPNPGLKLHGGEKSVLLLNEVTPSNAPSEQLANRTK